MDTAVASSLDQLTESFFTVWLGDGERAWARHVWGQLAEAGLVPSDLDDVTDPSRPAAVVTLAALTALSRQFWEVAVGEAYEAPCVVGDFPLLTELELGRYAGERGLPILSLPEDAAELSQFVANDAVGDVLVELSKIKSMPVCFAELWSQRAGATYPLGEEQLDEALNHPTLESLTAYPWLGELWAS